jgi:hypothetical protein
MARGVLVGVGISLIIIAIIGYVIPLNETFD